jgi:putative FmdB family regulatory protein
MPTYEYHCQECGYYFDVRATIAEKEKGLDIACEKCGSKELQQVFAGISITTGASVTRNTPSGSGGGCCGGTPGCCS